MVKKGKHATPSMSDAETDKDIASSAQVVDENMVPEKEPTDPLDVMKNQNELLLRQVAEMQDKYLRLAAEFDNYRKRTLKERSELIQTAGEDILLNILPLMDDFDRSLQVMDVVADVEGLRQGVLLIHSKFRDFLSRRGIKEMVATGETFNSDFHEAITTIAAPEEGLKGKVVDVVQKGYTMNDKIIRFAKVVVGQ